jgi:hypothetical protein
MSDDRPREPRLPVPRSKKNWMLLLDEVSSDEPSALPESMPEKPEP